MKTDKIGLFPGSFDPITNGHIDIIRRSAKLFDQLYVGIMENADKAALIPTQERARLIAENVSGFDNVKVITATGELTTNLAKRLGANFLVRGIRDNKDFEYESEMFQVNHALAEDIDTVYMIADPMDTHISSTLVKEIVKYGGPLSQFVPDNVAVFLKKKEQKNVKKY